MNVVVTVQHPAHVHFFRNPIEELEASGHDVHVFARAKDLTVDLLEAYDVPHTLLADQPSSTPGLLKTQVLYEYRLLREALRLDPDVMTAIGGMAVSHVARLVGATSVVFLDSEGALVNRATAPAADVVCTPRRFGTDFGAHHRRYDGYHALAYLHPNRFEPDLAWLRDRGVEPDSRFFVLRFASWDAHHDVGHRGFAPAAKRRLVSVLDERGEVYVTCEGECPPRFEDYRLPVAPHRVHDLLAAADLYVGDSGTMATEAAVLGTPAVRSCTHAGTDDMSNFRELETEYGLLYSFADGDDAIDAVRRLLERPDLAAEWERRREHLLADKTDVTAFVVERLLDAGLDGRSAGASEPEPRERAGAPDRG